LLPSAFRKYGRTGRVFGRESPEYRNSLRSVGRLFVDLVPVNTFRDFVSLFMTASDTVSEHEVTLLEKLSNDQYLARALTHGSEAFLDVINDEEGFLFRGNLDLWKQVIDHEHRVQIRDMVFMRPFGYLLGHGLAQHYGFFSEMLDVSSNPLVAGFFATRDSPHYRRKTEGGIGVIYRFTRPPVTPQPDDFRTKDFYSCPPTLSVWEMMTSFLEDDSRTGPLWDHVRGFLTGLFRRQKWRDWSAFKITATLFGATRIGRQEAALLVPDILYVGTGERRSPVHELVAVEDLAIREGTVAFYFAHSSRESKYITCDREYLWPNTIDPFYAMIRDILAANVMMDNGQILPSRIDLIDMGE
jgi:hypothetical protein